MAQVCAAVPFARLAEFDAARERLREAWERFEAAGPDPGDVDAAVYAVRLAELELAAALRRAREEGVKAWRDAPSGRHREPRFLRPFRLGGTCAVVHGRRTAASL
ncbi:MAG: hypothetical protein H5T97_06635 [Firmicutes bacterium]|nr:hypothetical protein [Bacillota bacterium]